MADLLKQEIIKSISIVPGLVGFSNIDFTKQPNLLSEGSWIKAIEVIENEKRGYDVRVAIFLDRDTRAKNVLLQLSKTVRNVFTKNKAILQSLNIYIRGVR